MTDHLTKDKRSWNMSRIRAKNTTPEIIVRSMLHNMGYRFRLHYSKLPGKPDIVLPKYKTVFFIHGCFWHRHKGCSRATIPKSNQDYWNKKFERNIQRFKEVRKAVQKEGWKVAVIWECETKDTRELERIIKKFLP